MAAKNRTGIQKEQAGASWRETGVLYIDSHPGGNAAAQVEVARLLADLEIPAPVREQVEAAVFRAVTDCQQGSCQYWHPETAPGAFQVRLSMSGQEEQAGRKGSSAPRWGFFIVQKVFDQLEPCQLGLDVYLYQE